MRNKFNIVIAMTALWALALTLSCSDYLEVPTNGAISAADFYKTDEDAGSAIAAAYDMLTFDFWNNTWASPVVMKSILSDAAQSAGPNASDQPGYEAMDHMTHSPSNDKVAALWGVNYSGIHRCNLVLDNIAAESPFKIQVLAEAKALRAYFYLDLVSYFGEVPIVTTTLLLPEEYQIAKSPKSAVYELIESDLQAALPDLPAKSAQSAADRFRMTKGAAHSLLGRARLYQDKFADALSSFEEVINSGEYWLETDYSLVFKKEGEFGAGSILEGAYSDLTGLVGGTAPWGDQRLFDTNMHVQLTGPRGDFFSPLPEKDFSAGWGFNLPSAKLAAIYDSAGDTYRKNATIMSEEDYLAAGGTITGDPFGYQGFLRLKYGTYDSEQGAGDAILNYGTNWRLIRYSDILLLASEAAWRLGEEGKGREYLNQVRNRAQLANSESSGDELFNDIVNERLMELAFEGFRFYDLVRWGLAAENIEGFEEGKHEHLPIPSGELDRAYSLVQTTGW